MLATLGLLVSLVNPPSATAEKIDVLAELLAGNKRFVEGKAEHPHQSVDRRAEQAKGQAPKAVVVGCADSRVSPELLFDQGIGDVFVVRAAGNIADVFALASIEYAVQHLGATHLMVLGHEKCGAVKAAVDAASPKKDDHEHHAAEDEPAPSSIGALVEEILPAVKDAKGKAGDWVVNSIEANAKRSMERLLEKSAFLKHRMVLGKLSMSCGVYSLDTGVVRVVPGPVLTGGFVKVHGEAKKAKASHNDH